MPASYCHLALHIVFSTRDRITWLKEPLAEDMYNYMFGIISNLKGESIQIGGVEDHQHTNFEEEFESLLQKHRGTVG